MIVLSRLFSLIVPDRTFQFSRRWSSSVVFLNSVVVDRPQSSSVVSWSSRTRGRPFQFSRPRPFLVVLSLFQFSRPWSSPVVLSRNFSLVLFHSVVVGRPQSSFLIQSSLVVLSSIFQFSRPQSSFQFSRPRSYFSIQLSLVVLSGLFSFSSPIVLFNSVIVDGPQSSSVVFSV